MADGVAGWTNGPPSSLRVRVRVRSRGRGSGESGGLRGLGGLAIMRCLVSFRPFISISMVMESAKHKVESLKEKR